MENEVNEIVLTYSQKRAYENFTNFLGDKDARVFILKGYAGTGKTTLIKKFVEDMDRQDVNFHLLASTGRAAKILSNTTKNVARTIHSEIYRFSKINQDIESVVQKKEKNIVDSNGQLYLDFELCARDEEDEPGVRYYIVDEASMVSDKEERSITQAIFGSGKLLRDLLEYDHNGKFIFVGDACQLPPVNDTISPALDSKYFLKEYEINAYESELTQIMRQAEDNDIVLSAQKVRNLYYNPQTWKWAKFPLRGYKNIHILDSQTELVNKYIEAVRTYGFNAATMICLTNKQSSQTTQIVRPAFGHLSTHIEVGDLLIITQNNNITGLMNGDLVIVEEVGSRVRRAGLTFLQVTVKEIFTGRLCTQLMIEEVLYSNLTNVSKEQHTDMMIDFYYRMKERNINQKSDKFIEMMMHDPFLNAMRAVYGYSLTCHKSQGGEWDYVFLDIARQVPVLQKPYVYQWVYTAMTRAKKDLYIVKDFWLM